MAVFYVLLEPKQYLILYKIPKCKRMKKVSITPLTSVTASPETEADEAIFREHLQIILGVEGWLSLEEAINLYTLAEKCQDGCIVEVGSYRGKSTLALALGTLAGYRAKVYAIDPHEIFSGVNGGTFGPQDRKVFMRNVARTDAYNIVRLVNLSSEIISPGWTEQVSLLWIDGDHSYEGVKRDWECWLPHLSATATVVFDDALDEHLGPSRLLKEILALDRRWHVNSIIGKTMTISINAKEHP